MQQSQFISIIFLALALTLSISFGSLAQIMQPNYHRVLIFTDNVGLREIAELGIAVDHGEFRPGVGYTTALSDAEMDLIRTAGFTFNIMPLSATSIAAKTEQETSCASLDFSQYTPPQNFNLGSMGGFYTYEEMLQHFDNMAALYPNLVTAKQPIGNFQTHEGLPLYWLRISDNATSDETDEPQVLYTALHHAREPNSLSQLIFFMYYLLENYNSDPDIKYLVDNTQLYFIPCVNPDGYIYNQVTFPSGGGMWRKNRRNNGDGSMGVDLNRNYGQSWGYNDSGSSPNTLSDTYRGPEPFSEPETQAVRYFCEQHQFKLALNYHTFSDLLIYPWGYEASIYTPDSALFTQYGQLLTQDNKFRFGTSNETVGYVTNGSSDDWMYGEQSTKPLIYAMTPEVGNADDFFWPLPERIIPLCQQNVSANLRLGYLALNYGVVTPANTDIYKYENNQTFHFNLRRLGLRDNGSFTVSLLPIQGIASVGTPFTATNLALNSALDGAITYTLEGNLAAGAPIVFDIVLNNGEGLTTRERITNYYGETSTLYSNDCNSGFDAFETDQWDIDQQFYYSPDGALADSPYTDYTSEFTNMVTLDDEIDLTHALQAELQFWAYWNIETRYDFAQIQALDAESLESYPLCGKYTIAGTSYQDLNQPVLEGYRNYWVKEQMPLTDVLGKKIKLRFLLKSDDYGTADGIYIDDIRVISINDSTSVAANGMYNTSNASIFRLLSPNPTSNQLMLYAENTNKKPLSGIIVLLNTLGKIVAQQNLNNPNPQMHINWGISNLPNGIYYAKWVPSSGEFIPVLPIAVVH